MKNIRFFVLLSFLNFGILYCYTDPPSGRISYHHNSSQQKYSRITTLIPALSLAKTGINFIRSFFSKKKNGCSCRDKDLCKVKSMSKAEISRLSDELEKFNASSLYGEQDSFETNWSRLQLDRLSSGAQIELRRRLEQECSQRTVGFSVTNSTPDAVVFNNGTPQKITQVKQPKPSQKELVRQNFIDSKKEIEKYCLGVCQKNQIRADAARRAVENNFRTTFQRYDLSDSSKQLLQENNI